MSVNLQNVAIQEFMDDVLHALKELNYSDDILAAHAANGGLIKRNITGEILNAPNYGDGFMVDRGAATSVIAAQEISKERKQTTFDNKVFLTYTDIFAQQDVNFDDLQELKKTCIDAKTREDNQFLIDKLASETYNTDATDTNAGYVFGTSTVPEVGSVDLLKRVKRIFDKKGVPTENRIALINDAFEEQLFEDEKFINSDYASKKVLVDGKLTNFMGITFVKVGNKVNTVNGKVYGLPLDNANDTVDCFFYETTGVVPGFRAVADRNIDVQWEQERQSWGAAVTTSGGCLIRQPARVIKVVVDNSL